MYLCACAEGCNRCFQEVSRYLYQQHAKYRKRDKLLQMAAGSTGLNNVPSVPQVKQDQNANPVSNLSATNVQNCSQRGESVQHSHVLAIKYPCQKYKTSLILSPLRQLQPISLVLIARISHQMTPAPSLAHERVWQLQARSMTETTWHHLNRFPQIADLDSPWNPTIIHISANLYEECT